MKKLIAALALVLACASGVKADVNNPTILFDVGQFKVYIPLKMVNTVGLWDFVAKQSLVGAETPIAGYKRLQFTAGAITSLDGQGAPFVGVHFLLINPAENFIPLSSFRPGIFGGRNFRQNSWEFGLKASVGLF